MRGPTWGRLLLFERIASYEAVFNRALIYRSACLHSGDVVSGAPIVADPRNGRLTANSIFLFAAVENTVSKVSAELAGRG
jgi:hypothetical protein